MTDWAYTKKERQKNGDRDTEKVTKWKVTQEDRLSRKVGEIPDWEDKPLVYVNNCSYNL
jgi:hypothetical protein